ncbi:MAG TPA: ACT domain-containing protein, partial [Archaeoglobus veneficus]|nr:ACT domain-containing protein [Archaeoglobus veneficus]
IMAEVFNRLSEAKVNVIMVSQSSSELNLSIVVDYNDVNKALKALKHLNNGIVNVSEKKDIAVISAVGAGMAGTPGVAGRIFSALGRNKINVIMISQSCSEFNVSFAVARKDGRKAVEVIHEEFNLGG